MHSNAVGIVLAGGMGSRFRTSKPKQYTMLNGHEVIWYSIDAFRKSKVRDIVVVVDEQEYTNGRIAQDYDVHTVKGGHTRNWSFKNALAYISSELGYCDKIVENNAACPMITSCIIDQYIALLDDYDFVSTTYKITDALGSVMDRKADRDQYFLIQSPDAYRFDVIYRYFDPESNLGHPGHHLPLEFSEYRNFAFQNNYKVTFPEDVEIIQYLMARRGE